MAGSCYWSENYNNKLKIIMANLYCTATYAGKGFYTHWDRHDFYLAAEPGDVWIVGDNSKGAAWINRVGGTAKTKAEAQAIVDGIIETAQARWDALPEAERNPDNCRPGKHTLA